MPRSRVLCIALVLGLGGCDSQIVLGDSEVELPLAGGPSRGGVANAGSAGDTSDAGTGASGGTPSSGGSSAGSAQAGVAGTDAPIAPPGDEVWSTDFEVGDFSDWQDGGAFYGGEYDWGNVNGYVDIGVGRDGSNGVVADIHSVARGETSGGVRMYRRTEDGPAYYSAWFRLEEAHAVGDWWSIFLFHAVDSTMNLDDDTSMWDMRVVDTPDGGMALQFFDHDVMQGTLAGPAGIVKSRSWFEIKAYLDYRPPDDTRVVVWLDDTLLFDMKHLHREKLANVLWSIGNGGSKLDPEESTLYVDDAAIHQVAKP